MGVVVGCVILVFITMVIPIAICCCCRGQHTKDQSGNESEVPSATNPALTTPTITTLPELVALESSPTVIRKNLVYHYANSTRQTSNHVHHGPSHTHQGSSHSHQGSGHSHSGSLDHTPRHLPLSHTNSAPFNRHATTPPAYGEPTML